MHENYDLDQLLELVQQKKFRQLKEILSNMNEVDIAEFLDELDVEQEILVFRLLPKDTAAEVFTYLENTDDQEKLIGALSDKETDDAVYALVKDDDDWQSCVFKLHVRAEYGGFQWIFGNFFDGEVFEFSLIQVFLEAFCFFVHFDSLFLNQ